MKLYKIDNENERKILRKKSKDLDLDEIRSSRTAKMIDEMRKLLSKEKYGVAIAAPQAGYSVSCFLISAQTMAHAKEEDFNPEKHKDLFVFNPKILKHSKKIIMSDEGCLSVPFKYSHSVPRFEKISIQYLDENGEKKTINASGFLARVLQHEYDHLQGILYIDKAHEIIDVDENLRAV